MPTLHEAGGKVLVWGSDIEDATIRQAAKTSRLPFLAGHVALMPDAHVGMGSTVGSVIPTQGAIIPAAIGVDIGCVDGATEYLSPLGWQRIDSYASGAVAQYHPDTGEADWVTPLRYVKREQASFLHFKTKYGIDQMLTPDHRVLCWRIEGRDRRRVQEVLTAEAFTDRHRRLVQGNKAEFEASFRLTDTLGMSHPDIQETAIRLQVMFMADGYLDRQMAQVNVRKARKKERAIKLLDLDGRPYRARTAADGNLIIRFRPPIATKSYGGLGWPTLSQAEIIAEECLYWDGNLLDRVFFTRDKASADYIQYCFAATGHRATLRTDNNDDGSVDYRVFAITSSRVSMGGSPKKADIKEVPSRDGFAYCFTVPSGFLVLRRNGNVFTTGNCGVVSTETVLRADQLPDDLSPLLRDIETVIPAGVNRGHQNRSAGANQGEAWVAAQAHKPVLVAESRRQSERACSQFGSLGSGNHFVEVCLDERDIVWLVLHSGSRGIGKQIAEEHIEAARGNMRSRFIHLEDHDLAYLVQGEGDFKAYIADMLWAQDYALANRQAMMHKAVWALTNAVDPDGDPTRLVAQTINCHHNFTQMEHHHGRNVWLTRKGAIKAAEGDLGVIPGSMGTRTYIVRGLGNPASYNSCSHGAGRRMSRSRAKAELSLDSLTAAMVGKTWLADRAQSLLDEHPGAYKDIDQVMVDQADLVEVVHTLHQVLNFKGC